MAVEDVLFKRLGKTFPPGTVLFREGERGQEMFVIQSGKVRITKEVRGAVQTLAILGPGEFFGEMAILNNKPRSANAIVEEEAKMLVIDPKQFGDMIRGNPEIAVRMIKKLAQRLEEADRQIESLLLKDSNSRVVHTLARLADLNGKPTPEGIRLPLTLAKLAEECGLAEEKVQQILAKIINAKIITLDADGFLIPNVERLLKVLDYFTMKEELGDL